MDLGDYKNKLQEAGVVFAEGLSDPEVQLVEELFGFKFPPDLKRFLMFALPTGGSWPNWRNINDPELRRMLDWPYEGICFDIEMNGLWPKQFGPKPASLEDSLGVAKRFVDAFPKLIPICGHRYLPDRPAIEDNPVFSVYQLDIIYYGSNLWTYLHNEFYDYLGPAEDKIQNPIRHIDFWSDIVDDNY